jgi:hypothetical protein
MVLAQASALRRFVEWRGTFHQRSHQFLVLFFDATHRLANITQKANPTRISIFWIPRMKFLSNPKLTSNLELTRSTAVRFLCSRSHPELDRATGVKIPRSISRQTRSLFIACPHSWLSEHVNPSALIEQMNLVAKSCHHLLPSR